MQSRLPVAATMLCAGMLTAQFVAARAARDAIYLANLDVTSLPQIVIATAVCSIGLVALSSMSLRRLSPASVVPLAFGISALLFVAEWVFLGSAPAAVARLLYLHVSGLGPMLASGFWLIATESFDPHTAKKHFGRIAGAGTLGGLLGAVVAERVANLLGISAVLLVLAAMNVVCGWQTRLLARPLGRPGRHLPLEVSPELSAEPARLGLRALATVPYLRHLGALVLLGTMGAALVDYLFKAEAVAALGRGESLLRFFAAYYAGVSVITFVIQVFASRLVLERLGLAVATATPSIALLFGGAGALLLPGLPATMLTRASESVFRGSLFRSAYEIFYTPVAPAERRAAKSIIDVGFDRLGDALGGVAVRLAQMLAASQQHPAMVGLAMACSALALVTAGRLRRGYVLTLERSLLNRAVELDLSEIQDVTTRTAMFRTIAPPTGTLSTTSQRVRPAAPSGVMSIGDAAGDPELQRIAELRSGDPDRVVRVLQDEAGIPAALVPHVVTLLAWDAVAEDAVRALRTVAEERIGELTDALLDRNQPFAVRRRLARVFSTGVSQRAADGLIAALDDLRFEVRFQCGRSLAAILERNPRVRIDSARVFEAIDREVAVSRPVWEGRQLLDRLEESSRTPLDDFVSARANQSLSHVFTLLSLVLPTEPLRIAFRGLHTSDPRLRGTSLEYLEQVLPAAIRERLWPFLDAPRVLPAATRPREEVLQDLMRSNPSIMVRLEELRRRQPGTTAEN